MADFMYALCMVMEDENLKINKDIASTDYDFLKKSITFIKKATRIATRKEIERLKFAYKKLQKDMKPRAQANGFPNYPTNNKGEYDDNVKNEEEKVWTELEGVTFVPSDNYKVLEERLAEHGLGALSEKDTLFDPESANYVEYTMKLL